MDVLVVGAGPVGLSAALGLAELGIKCRIVERRTKPSELSRAVGIIPQTLGFLRPSEAGEAIVAEGMALSHTRVVRGGKTLLEIDASGPAFQGHTMIGLPQNRTEEILRDPLHRLGVTVEYGHQVEQISTDPDHASVDISDQVNARFDWVIAADGIGSTVRQQLGIAYPGFDLATEWSIAGVDLQGAFDPRQAIAYIQGPGGLFVLVLPIEAHRVRVVSSTPDALAALPQPLGISRIRRTVTFKISVRQVETYQRGRVLLAGDAAHCHSPVGGRGMNLGIDDAFAAAKAVHTGNVGTYATDRHKIGGEVMRASESARKTITSNGAFSRSATGAVLAAVQKLPRLQRAVMARMTSF